LAGQPHEPAVQLCPDAHFVPQPPQFVGSLPITFTHAPAGHCVRPVAHVAEHMPAEQFGVAPVHAVVPHVFAVALQ
jgi:hypothetical protein